MESSPSFEHQVFFEIHSDLPRESAGSIASTLRALDIIKADLPPNPEIADMGCGPGSSAIPLAKALPDAVIHAFDLHTPFLDELSARSPDLVNCGCIKPAQANMMEPPVTPRSLDLIWSEGAIYNCGIDDGLAAWKQYLKPGGFLVFNDVVWLTPSNERPDEISKFWAEYPGMQDIPSVEDKIEAAGFDLLGAFDLPEADWWTEYYNPMSDRLDRLESKYQGIADARPPLEMSRYEIEMRERFSEHCNYRFFATRLRS